MKDEAVQAQVIELLESLGREVLAAPTPPRFSTMGELRTVFDAVDGPLAAKIAARLRELRPGVPMAEELGEDALPMTGEVWTIDALDGAVQYLHDLPAWCLSVTLIRDGAPVLAVLHAPTRGETYAARAGAGATRNGKPIAPAAKRELAAAYTAMSQPPFVARSPADVDLASASLSAMLRVVGAVRNLGATSWQIADVGGGRIDLFWQFGRDDVNVAGGALIAREAGAVVTDCAGRPWALGATSILVSSPSLHEAAVAALRPLALR